MQEMSTIYDAEAVTTVAPNTTNPPALIAMDANWFFWPVNRRPFNHNVVMEIVDWYKWCTEPHFSVQLSKDDQKKRETLAIYYLSRIEQHKKEKNN